MFAITSLSIWRSGNASVWENMSESAARVIFPRKRAWCSSRTTCSKWSDVVANSARVHQVQYWLVFSEQHNTVGTGICLRDEYEMFMGAKTLKLQPILNVNETEASDLLASIKWMRELEFKQTIFTLWTSQSMIELWYVLFYVDVEVLYLNLVTILMLSFLGETNMALTILSKWSYTMLDISFILAFPLMLIFWFLIKKH